MRIGGQVTDRTDIAVDHEYDPLRLAELLAIRLCHDLSGPLGTLMGTLEMVAEDPAAAGEALPIAGDVSTALGRRLKLLRAAWGGTTPALSVGEFAALVEGVPRRWRFELGGLDPAGRFSPAGARLALNVALLAAEALPVGGAAMLAGDPAGDVLVAIDGRRAAWPAGFTASLGDPSLAWQALRGAEGVDGARGLQGWLTALIARSSGLRLSFLVAATAEAAPPLLLNLGG
jgi:histidine phosphotransferase ChpT